MRSLVVDDNALLRDTLRAILESLGAHVTEAADGNQALACIVDSAAPFDVIMCDLHMPNRDGIQFLRALAECSSKAGIILISGHDAEVLAAAADIGRRHDLNVIGHLKKPFTRADVRGLLVAHAASEQQRAAAAVQVAIDQNDIHRGLAAREFAVVFQPKVDCVTCAVTGAEALVRWHHPRLGVVPPATFIPVAEAGDVIDPLTDFILEETLRLCSMLRDEGWDAPISVNLSTRSMVRLDLPDRLAQAVAAHGVSPRAIIFEVTESKLAENTAALIETCARLRLMGFKLSIDDFGTGFSTLEQLKLLPVSELKVDRAFVAGAPANPRVRHILEASLILGDRLGLACVCEGVETRAEWELIRGLGHHLAQGYLIGKPMPSSDLPAWSREWERRTAGGTLN